MNLINFLVIVLVMSVLDSSAVNTGSKGHCANVKAPLAGLRKKRHLTFPPGTNMVLTLSLLKALMTHAPSGWNVAVEIDVLYPLLSPEMMNAFFKKKLHHRQKREFWEIIDNAFASYNMNGRSCVYRSICEAKLHLAPPGRSLVHDILRSIFSCNDDIILNYSTYAKLATLYKVTAISNAEFLFAYSQGGILSLRQMTVVVILVTQTHLFMRQNLEKR